MQTCDFETWPGMPTQLGLRGDIVLESKECSSVSRIKSLVFRIGHELDRMAKTAADDRVIANGDSGFFGEAFFNLVKMIQDSTQNLPPRAKDESPTISFEVCSGDVSVRNAARHPSRPSTR